MLSPPPAIPCFLCPGGGPTPSSSFPCLLSSAAPGAPSSAATIGDPGLWWAGLWVQSVPSLLPLGLGLAPHCPQTPGWAPQLCQPAQTCVWGAGVYSQLGPTPQGRGVQGGVALGPSRSAASTACAVLPGPAGLGARRVLGDRIAPLDPLSPPHPHAWGKLSPGGWPGR